LLACMAPVLFWQALANVGLPMAVSWNGFQTAKAAQARMRTAENDAGILSVVADDSVATLALSGYAKEPLATAAVFVIAQSSVASGLSAAERAMLIERAVEFHKRDKLVQVLALEQAVSRSDYKAAFQHLDALAKMRAEVIAPILDNFQPLLAQTEGRKILEEALSDDPTWAAMFWSRVPTERAQLAGYRTLKNQLDPSLRSDDIQRLLNSLVINELYDDGIALVESLGTQKIQPSRFIDSTSFPPIGWTVQKDANIAFSETAPRQYSVFLARTHAGALASQVVVASGGEYNLTVGDIEGKLKPYLKWRLQCISKVEQRFEAPLGRSILLPDDCPHWLLTLYGDAWDASTDVAGQIGLIDFTREPDKGPAA